MGEPQLWGEGAPEYWADVVVGEVLEEHRPIDRGDPLEEAVIYSAARPSGGPGAAERWGQGRAGGGLLLGEAEDRRLHLHLLLQGGGADTDL